MNILFVNHGISKSCGVHAQGVRHFNSLKKSTRYNFIYCEINSFEDLIFSVNIHRPKAIMYNYMPVVMPWVNQDIISLGIKNICIIHNITPQNVGTGQYIYEGLFDAYITLDDSLNVDNKILFKTSRPIYEFNIKEEPMDLKNPKIGTFGFPFLHKGFHKIVKMVNDEFDSATINLHMTDSYFCHNQTSEIIELCLNSITKNGIKLNYTSQYLSEMEMIEYLSQNDINALFHDNIEGVGVSASIDYLISAQKPILLSNSQQFRNFKDVFHTYHTTGFRSILDDYKNQKIKVKEVYLKCLSILDETEKIIEKIC